MRSKIIAANWKMHKTFDEGLQLAQAVINQLKQCAMHEVQVILLPPFIHLEAISKLLPSQGNLHIGAQNCHEKAAGAFTGEIAAPMLRSVGAHFVLVGHSERRQYFKEDSALLAEKVSIALEHGLRPIFCCGEPWQSREQEQQVTHVYQQLTESLLHLSYEQIAQVIIAYEPVWAIGTGKTPTPPQIQAMHEAIRSSLVQRYGTAIAEVIPILYGGSCNAQNAPALLTCSAVDGALIGGASLQADTFVAIVNSLCNQT